MSRSSVCVAARPVIGRWKLLVAASILTLAWSSVTMSQETVLQEAVLQQAVLQEAILQERVDSARPALLIHVGDASPTARVAAPSAATVATPVGPVLTSGLIRYVPSASRSLDAPTVEREQRGPGLGRNVALVIVGVAAMIIGSDVDDTPGNLLIAAGAGMTLYGLYYILK